MWLYAGQVPVDEQAQARGRITAEWQPITGHLGVYLHGSGMSAGIMAARRAILRAHLPGIS